MSRKKVKYPRWIKQAAKNAIKAKNCNHNWDYDNPYIVEIGIDKIKTTLVNCKNCTMVKFID